MSKIKVCVHGLGNIGRYAIESIEASSDMECIGIVRRKSSIGNNSLDLRGLNEYSSVDELIKAKGKPQVALICTPSRNVPLDDEIYLNYGINSVDSFDIHEEIIDLVEKLDKVANANNAVAVTAAGWDPGSDSVLRCVFEAMIPVGTTFTNFGRGMSMGHSVAVRNIKGVANGVSITIPIGGGRHSRLVYVVLKAGETLDNIKTRISTDEYFAKDPLEVREVKSSEELSKVCDASHGVLMDRTGASGLTPNQKVSFDMRINNPALTAQIMVSSARATTKLPSGCYTMIDIPPVMYLDYSRKDAIKKLV